jgi:4-alpha-glucanotransferase
MKSAILDEFARHHGVSLTRPSPDNVEVPISDKTKRKLLAALNVDLTVARGLPEGGLKRARKGSAKTTVAKSYVPQFLENSRVWGISTQLYELRSARNWGIGDYEDLVDLIGIARPLGADFIGLTPLHAPFLADPDRCSPYEPSNRQLLNPLYIAVDKVPGFQSEPELEKRLQELRMTKLVDYVGVAHTKYSALRRIWRSWQSEAVHRPALGRDEFIDFVKERGEVLRLHALFEAISSTMSRSGRGTGWTTWPAEYQSATSPAVAQFCRDHDDDVNFHMWLQWLAHRQLMRAAQAARDAGLKVGLYLDLAVGEAVDGSATWSDPDVYIAGATIGSPPDPNATEGQDWHLAALHPSAIAAGRNSPYRRMVNAAMRYAGAIRIDHAAALRRLFLVPLDCGPDGGGYVDYPQADLLRILAQASGQYRCLVIGEALGMLPDGLEEDLAEARILSYRILSYERDQDGFKPAAAYPKLALACISTHDHQTLAGWWRGADIRARAEHGIVPSDLTERHVEERKEERRDLRQALVEAGGELPKRLPPQTATAETLTSLVVSAHLFIAKTPSMLAAVRLADMTGEKSPTNIPGTKDSYPNWKPKLSAPVEDLPGVPLLQAIASAMRQVRG